MKIKNSLIHFMVIVLVFTFSGILTANPLLSEKERLEKGKELFETKTCAYCHSINNDGGKKTGPDLGKWESLKSPVLWAAIMWNHVPEMTKVFNEKKISYPAFTGDEIDFLFEYIHSQSELKGSTYSFPGDADRGAFLFQYLGCIQCHSVNNKGGKISVDLSTIAINAKSDSELAARMITHAPYMGKEAAMQNLYWPKLQGNEIAHLFLYFKSLTD